MAVRSFTGPELLKQNAGKRRKEAAQENDCKAAPEKVRTCVESKEGDANGSVDLVERVNMIDS